MRQTRRGNSIIYFSHHIGNIYLHTEMPGKMSRPYDDKKTLYYTILP